MKLRRTKRPPASVADGSAYEDVPVPLEVWDVAASRKEDVVAEARCAVAEKDRGCELRNHLQLLHAE